MNSPKETQSITKEELNSLFVEFGKTMIGKMNEIFEVKIGEIMNAAAAAAAAASSEDSMNSSFPSVATFGQESNLTRNSSVSTMHDTPVVAKKAAETRISQTRKKHHDSKLYDARWIEDHPEKDMETYNLNSAVFDGFLMSFLPEWLRIR